MDMQNMVTFVRFKQESRINLGLKCVKVVY